MNEELSTKLKNGIALVNRLADHFKINNGHLLFMVNAVAYEGVQEPGFSFTALFISPDGRAVSSNTLESALSAPFEDIVMMVDNLIKMPASVGSMSLKSRDVKTLGQELQVTRQNQEKIDKFHRNSAAHFYYDQDGFLFDVEKGVRMSDAESEHWIMDPDTIEELGNAIVAEFIDQRSNKRKRFQIIEHGSESY